MHLKFFFFGAQEILCDASDRMLQPGSHTLVNEGIEYLPGEMDGTASEFWNTTKC